MIEKELLVKYNSWQDIIILLDKFCSGNFHEISYNVEVDSHESRIKTIQLVSDECIFCEYEFDDRTHTLLRITNDGKVTQILTLVEFVYDMGNEINKFDKYDSFFNSKKQKNNEN